MPRLYVQKHTIPGYGPGFFPADEHAYGLLASVPDGKYLTFKDLRQPRSIEHHRFFFKFIHTVHENLPERYSEAWPTTETFLDFLKIKTGWREDIYDADGNIIALRPRSLSFASMDEMEFRGFVRRVKDLLARELWPEMAPPGHYGHNSRATWNEAFADLERMLFGQTAEQR